MKNFLFHNDKSTKLDELYLFLFIILCIGVGILIYAFVPAFWIISKTLVKTFGLIWIIAGLVFIPGLIYRLFSND